MGLINELFAPGTLLERASEALVDTMMGEADYREGVRALTEKQPLKWGSR